MQPFPIDSPYRPIDQERPGTSATSERERTAARGALHALRLAVPAILLLAFALRLWGATHDLPFSYYGDELHFMKRAMALGTGDLNPHWFHKPAFLMYILAFFYGLYFVAGLAVGRFDSTAELGAHFLTDPMPFLLIGRLVVAAFGVATVYVVYLIGKRVYDSRKAGIAAAVAAAVMAPMIASSVVIKSDVPCGFLMTLSVYLYLGTRETERLKPLALAALAAGAAMGTHYYGVVLVPAFLALEGLRGLTKQTPWGRVLLRGTLVGVLFVLGFFLTSPYNFLDPMWGKAAFEGVQRGLGLTEEPVTHYEPDSGTEYVPGVEAWIGASVAFLEVAAQTDSIGIVLGALALLGLAVALARRETRWYGLLVLVPCLFFFFAAITIAAYHAQPRHLNAIYPLLATLVWPAALALARLFRAPRHATSIALLVAVLAAVPTLLASVDWLEKITRLDTRLVSYKWALAHIPPGERFLLDEYGPLLNPGQQAVARLKARLATLPESPFIHHQALRLDLLSRYPARDGLNFDELGHQWWLPREKTDAELASNETDLDMGTPLISRERHPLDHYRRQGIRYVISNDDAQKEYYVDRGEGFPSFVRFYDELRATRQVITFDPKDWNGKGPVVWVYDITKPARPGQVHRLRGPEEEF